MPRPIDIIYKVFRSVIVPNRANSLLLVYPANFPCNNRYPSVLQRLRIRRISSDTIEEEGLALVVEELDGRELFCG